MTARNNYFIHNAFVVNELKVFCADVLIQKGKIAKILKSRTAVDDLLFEDGTVFIDATGKYLLPGVIDVHVHFREPGLTHKGDFFTESRAAVAGGVTSVMDMPNVIPPTTTTAGCKERFNLAKNKFFTNYSFYIAATEDNANELKQIDNSLVCGVKLFMGSSTGNLLVENEEILKTIFQLKNIPVAVHCEDESIIKANMQKAKQQYGENVPIEQHAEIRSEEACFRSSQKAVEMARKYGTRLHVLHLTTAKELALFSSDYPKITAEACVSYLCLDKTDYPRLGTCMKCNPSIKNADDRAALFDAVVSGKIASIASDHAPHTAEEKNNSYFLAPSGLPMIQHTLPLMLEFCHEKKLSLETLVDRMCHTPARIFNVKERGFIKEGFSADLVLVDLEAETKIEPKNIHYKCGWSPFTDKLLHSRIEKTFVNGEQVYDNGKFAKKPHGKPLEFVRKSCILFLLVFSLVFSSCGNKKTMIEKPKDLIERQAFEKILMDVYLIEGEVRSNIRVEHFDSLRLWTTAELTAMYEKNGITHEQFMNSYAYYVKNPELSEEMMKNIVNQLVEMQAKEEAKQKEKDSIEISKIKIEDVLKRKH